MKSLKIMVVDDDPIVLSSCERVLRAEGFAVVLACRAADALAKARAENVDLMLVDVKMPHHDGWWFIRQAREQGLSVPVVVITGYPVPDVVAEAAALGAAELVAKPFTPDELVASVRRALAKEEQP